MEPGFVKADSHNLSVVDAFMVDTFYRNNPDFLRAEIRNVKAQSSTREHYGDDAIGYVQVKRENALCIVKARICLEHRVHNKGYGVTVIINELEQTVCSSECHDCVASAGGCKHGIAMLLWLHRRSEEPSVTSVDCYWRASKLSKVGKTLKSMKIIEMSTKNVALLDPIVSSECQLLKKYVEKGKEVGSHSVRMEFFKEDDAIMKTSIHNLSLIYQQEIQNSNYISDPNGFLNYCRSVLTETDCNIVAAVTSTQSKSSKWYDARYARITASKLYQGSKCKTQDGSLVESIFGAYKTPQTSAMVRGLSLEDAVLGEVVKKYPVKFRKTGLIVSKDFPIFGASPDAISEIC